MTEVSEISEEQAREAIAVCDAAMKMLEYDDVDMTGAPPFNEIMDAANANATAAITLREFVRQELNRRDAEKSERALPITAEWLESIGAKKKTATRWYVAPHVAVHLRDEFVFVIRIGGCMAPIVTRGQLLDLVEIVKGGVE